MPTFDMKDQILRLSGIPPEHLHQKIHDLILFFQHLKWLFKKFRYRNDIDSNILFTGLHHTVLHILVHHKKVSLFQEHFLLTKSMCKCTLIRIHQFNITMSVQWNISFIVIQSDRCALTTG